MVTMPIITNPKKLDFELYAGTSYRKLDYISTYEFACYTVIGNLVFFQLNWRGQLKESGEKAFVSSNLFTKYLPKHASSLTICDAVNLFTDSNAKISGLIDTNGLAHFEYGYGTEVATWIASDRDNQYLKISGFYMFE